jgi:hypothetical protein
MKTKLKALHINATKFVIKLATHEFSKALVFHDVVRDFVRGFLPRNKR